MFISGIPFDREVQDKYELVIEVRSEAGRGINPRVAHVIVDIEVLDMNDNAPMFVNLPYFAIVQRSKSKKDSSVIKVDIFVVLELKLLNTTHIDILRSCLHPDLPCCAVARVIEQCCFNSAPDWLFKISS